MEFQSWIKPDRLSDHNHHKVILLEVDFFIETSTAAMGEWVAGDRYDTVAQVGPSLDFLGKEEWAFFWWGWEGEKQTSLGLRIKRYFEN